MFARSFPLVLFVALTTAEVPSYIHVCGRRNPKLDQCILDSVSSLVDKLKTGIPELSVPSADPLFVDHIDLLDMENFKASANNVTLHGLSEFTANRLHVDLDKKRIDIDLTFPNVELAADYSVSAKILVPIAGQGPIRFSTDDVAARVVLYYKLVKRNGGTYLYFYEMSTKLNIKDFRFEFRPSTGSDSTLSTAIHAALGENRQEITEATTPNIEKAVSSRVLVIANTVCKRFTYDELFPDRE